ncbi:Gfo/Idh/MocA family oxidoreductase [Verrucomicrobiales bacterium]|nr:Gfo/Idh/MocA family oxidoreductase [Verrucomicrobiales bacterium]
MDRKHKILVIGTGSIGERHLRCLQTTGRCEMAFCEPMDSCRAEVAERYGIHSDLAFENLDSAVASTTFDAAVVAAPAPFHIPIGMQLAKAGIHILMEKPLSLSMDGVQEFADLVKEESVVVAVGYTHRAHSAMIGLKEKLDSGKFGRPLELRVDIGQPLAVIRPAYADVYFADPKMGGGSIQDMITHFYSIGDWLLGPMNKIVTHAKHMALPRVTVEDTVHSLADHGGVMATYAQNLTQAQNEVITTVICEGGSIRANYGKKRVSWITEPDGEWNHEPFEMGDIDEIYIRQDNAFLDEVEGHGKSLCTLEEGIRTLKVNIASLKSAETFTWQEIS